MNEQTPSKDKPLNKLGVGLLGLGTIGLNVSMLTTLFGKLAGNSPSHTGSMMMAAGCAAAVLTSVYLLDSKEPEKAVQKAGAPSPS